MGPETRRKFLALRDEDLKAAVDGLPLLAPAWAKMAKVPLGSLQAGSERALRGLRAAAARHTPFFVETLVDVARLTYALDAEDPADGGERVLELCRALRAATSQSVAEVFVTAVVEGDLEGAVALAGLGDGLFDALQPREVPGGGDEDRASQPSGVDEGPQPGHGADDVRELLGALEGLRKRQLVLADQLRRAAEQVQRGELAEPTRRDFDDWSAQVQHHLRVVSEWGPAANLEQALDTVRRRVDDLTRERSHLEETVAAVQALLAADMGEAARDLMRARGFSDLAALDSAASWHGLASALPAAGEEPGSAGDRKPTVAKPGDTASGTNRAEPRTDPPPSVDSAVQPSEPPQAHRPRAAGISAPEMDSPRAADARPTVEAVASDTTEVNEPPFAPAAPPDETTAVITPVVTPTPVPTVAPDGPVPDNPVGDLPGDPAAGSDRTTDPVQPVEPPGPSPRPADPGVTEILDDTSPTVQPRRVELPQVSLVLGDPLVALPPLPVGPDGEAGADRVPVPPAIPALISGGDPALAMLSASTSEPADRQQLLRWWTAASLLTLAGLERTLPYLVPDDATLAALGTDDSRLALAAGLKSALRLGYAPVGLHGLSGQCDLPPKASAAITELVDVAVRGFRRDDTQTDGPTDTLERLRSLGDAAQQTLHGLRNRQIKLARATQIIRYASRDGQLVSDGLSTVVRAGGGGIGHAEATPAGMDAVRQLARLTQEEDRARLIDEIDRRVSSRVQLIHKLEAGALAKLHQDLAAAGEIAADFLALRAEINSGASAADVETRGRMLAAAESARGLLPPDTPGPAALADLLTWVDGETATYQHDSMESLLATETRLAWSVPRDPDGFPARALEPAEVAYLLGRPTPMDAVTGYAAVGNLDAARELTLDLPAGSQQTDADDLIAQARGRAQQRHDSLLNRLDRECWRLRALQQDELARQVSAEAEPLRDPATGRWDLVLPRLEALIERCEQQLVRDREALLARARDLSCSAQERERIELQIRAGDEPLALEFITAAEAGQPLPSTAQVQADDYLGFFPGVVDVAAQAASLPLAERLATVRQHLGHDQPPVDRQLGEGLQAWITLQNDLRRQDTFRLALAQVLRMLGLVPAAQGWLREHGRATRAGFSTFRVKAQPIGRSYVPSLGTQALGEYLLLIAWDQVASPGRLLDFVEESDRTRPVVILYRGVLTAAQRTELRAQTLSGPGKGFSPLVVDDAVIGWLSTRGEPGWRLTQRITLPFTSINPYTPFAAGEVPDEVFVGRNDERRRIEDPTGSMFLYGGRQLGKSALLRRVERLTNQHRGGRVTAEETPQGPVAIYLDLKAAQIGEAREPAELWGALAERLREARIAGSKLSRQAGVRDVRAAIRDWLDQDESNRLLLLLDEADNFLTSDSGLGDTSQRRAEFPTLGALKELLESTNRRVKPVFAGLHQVQRFHDSANTPVAHGGQDILIGPLRPQDAYQLVEEPLTALGYRFESPELVWRLLLFTNYQASLVQIVCEALVRHMSRRRIAADGPQILITRADVETVHADREVRELIAQRFRWTINLDPRYRLIALVVALRSLDAQPGETFEERDLREECETWWPVGFEAMSDGEFRRYLVEMVGLGVLHQQGPRFGLRSPHIVGMLGSRESLNRELDEANRLLELPQEYNAAMHRSPLDGQGTLDAPRSPFTDAELVQILQADPTRPNGGVHVVVGSEALGLSRVPKTLAEAARRLDGPPVERVTASDTNRLQTLVRRRAHVLLDLTTEPLGRDDLTAAVNLLRRAARLTGTVCVGPDALDLLPALSGLPVLQLSKWSVEGLQAWRESPFTGPDLRRRLVRVTGGWPVLVEQVMGYCVAGSGADDALGRLVQHLARGDAATEFLVSTGVELDVAIGWGRWLTVPADADGLVESVPATLEDVEAALERPAGDLLDRLALLDMARQTDDGWVLDRAVAAAGSALAASG